MATLPQLLSSLEPYTTMLPRRLREAGAGLTSPNDGVMLAAPVGRVLKHRTVEDAAAVAVGVFSSPTPGLAGQYARHFLKAERKRGAIVQGDVLEGKSDLYDLMHDALLKPTLLETVVLLIANWSVLERGLAEADKIAAGTIPGKGWKSSVTFEFVDYPWFDAHVEFAIENMDESKSDGFEVSPSSLFIMDAQYVGKKAVEITEANIQEVTLRGMHTARRTFDHRALIALGKRLDGVA